MLVVDDTIEKRKLQNKINLVPNLHFLTALELKDADF